MRILIVEDETAAYENLLDILQEVDAQIEIAGNTESVSQTVHWLNTNGNPDIIFMDIHLSDGSAFAIFDQIQIETPIIFTTAYDQYAIDAFKVNSIDYILKPIKVADIKQALNKYSKLSKPDVLDYIAQLSRLNPSNNYCDKLLIPHKDKLLPVAVEDISYFYTVNKNTTITLKNGTTYIYSKTLEQIMIQLDPAFFFRANKQFIINKTSVKDITIWFDSRLLVTLDTQVPERIYISKNRASEFKAWMTNSSR